MKPKEFLRDRQDALFLFIVLMAVFSTILYWLGNQLGIILIMDFFILISFTAILFKQYYKLHKYWNEIHELQEGLDKKYLLTELLSPPDSYEAAQYQRLLRTTMKSMLEDVSKAQQESREYREYIEQWVHEIKLPITAVKLISENDRSGNRQKLISQAELMEGSVEKVLYFARMHSVEKDYLIRALDIKSVVRNVLSMNKQYLMLNQVSVDTENVSGTVFSDEKWVSFILKQLIVNSIKYKSGRPPHIKMETAAYDQKVTLRITDNGIGIDQSELSRIFDKGYTGTNGRRNNNSTGIGLFLCRELCNKLGMSMSVESQVDQYTAFTLVFPRNDMRL